METQNMRENSFTVLFQSLITFLWQITYVVYNTFASFLHTNSDQKGSYKNDFTELGSTISLDSTCSLSPSPSNEVNHLKTPMIEESFPRAASDIHLSISEDEHVIEKPLEDLEIRNQADNDEIESEERAEGYSSNDDLRTGNSDVDIGPTVEKSEVEKDSAAVTQMKKKKTRRGKKKPKTVATSLASLDPLITPQSTPTKTKQSTPNKNHIPEIQDERFKNFRMRGGSKSNGSSPSKAINQPKQPSMVGKHETQETPRRFSHSALAQKFKDADNEPTIKPLRQPAGPILGTNGFSSEYQRQRRDRMGNQLLLPL